MNEEPTKNQEIAQVLADSGAEPTSVGIPNVGQSAEDIIKSLEKENGGAPAPETAAEAAPEAAEAQQPAHMQQIADPELNGVKNQAIQELRPLVDKLDIAPEEKFDTYLLLIRSTDDKTLIAPAHEVAKTITDETRRAQALLDIIKEIDYLSNQK